MTGFLKPHGSSIGIGGEFVSLNMSDDEIEAGAHEHPDLSVLPFDVDRVFEDELDDDKDVIFCGRVKIDSAGIIDLDCLSNPHRNFDPHTWDDWNGEWVPNAEFDGFGVVRDDKEVFSLAYSQFEYQCDERDKEEDFRSLDRYSYEDPTLMPSFSSNREGMRPLTEDEGEYRWYRSHMWYGRNCGRKQAKWRSEDGLRARKSSRSDRHGNRQEFAELRDYWADLYEEMLTIPEFVDYPRIPEYGVEMVGLTDADASYYEAEAQREREDYIRELEMAAWEANFDWDYSHIFDPVNNTGLLTNIWERHLFPEQFEDYRRYRFSEWDHYDDFGYYDERDRYDDDRHLDGLDLGDLSDEGPTLEEWTELDRIAIERLLEDEDDRFSPSFVGSRRTMLRYHLSEPRRGKLKRKFSKSGSFLYRQTGAPRRAMYT